MSIRATAPSLSVCLASFNGAHYIQAQIDSILSQLGPEDELIVSDDGSTDGTPQILASYGPRVRVVGLTRAGGVVRNFERALAACQGEIVVLSDQDDVWLDGRLALIRDRLRAMTLVMTNGEVVDSDLHPVGVDVLQLVRFKSGFVRNFVSPTYVGCCMAFRRELLEIALPFPSHILWHDWYLALVAELLFTSGSVGKKTILFRRHANNASTTGQRSTRSLWEKLGSRVWMARAVGVAVLRWSRMRMATSQ